MPIFNTFKYVVWETFSSEGVRYNSFHVSGPGNMATPTIVSELSQFRSAMQWLRTSIPEFSISKQRLLNALKRSYHASREGQNDRCIV